MSPAQRASLSDTLVHAFDMLWEGLSSICAVEEAICSLEASGLFNAGVGARLQMDGIRRMDASIMEGRHLKAGAVAGIEGVQHPIKVARLVLERTNHVLLVGPLATRFARRFTMKFQPRLGKARASKRGTAHKKSNSEELETVGAVALDRSGTLAAGASTGGIGVMLPGRVGDSPLIGSGVYADNESGAVSMTGLGESIIRIAVAKEITDRLAGGVSPAPAARLVLSKLVRRIQGSAGALVLSRHGRFAIRHTTPYMAAGYWNGKGRVVVADRFP